MAYKYKPLEEDFDFAARFYCAQALGTSKAETLELLKRKHESEEYVDPLVLLFMQCRQRNTRRLEEESPEDRWAAATYRQTLED